MGNNSSENTGSYNPLEMPQGFKNELKRLKIQANYIWVKERKKLQYFGLKDGITMLEVGVGPGYVTELLLKDFPNLEITGVDINKMLISEAMRRFSNDPRVHIKHASVYDLPFDNETFDLAYVRLVLQHLEQPLRALKEIKRVLKKRGKIVILDVDEELLGIMDPDFMNWKKYNKQLSKLQAKKGGDRRIGRKLVYLLKKAGFKNVELEAIIAHSDELGIENFLKLAWGEEDIDWAIKNNLIDKEEGEKQKTLYRLFISTKDKKIITLVFVCGGEK